MALLGLRRGLGSRFGALRATRSSSRYSQLQRRPFSGSSRSKWEPPPSSRLDSGERPKCVVLHCTSFRASPDRRQLEEYLRQEADALVETLGFEVAMSETVRLRKFHPRTFIGRGKLGDLRGIVAALGAATVFINTPFLTALQQRHLGQALNTPVRDRMMVILEIFASRARTSEAKLQVELARSKYALSHLVRGAEASYAQQRGGVGGIFGAGEKALELRRRDLRDRIKGLQVRLKVVERRREEQRKHRRQSTVSLVGYTNAGKSTLLNALTGGDSVSVMDRPFETLDTTTRGLFLPELGVTTLLTDTVGFITDLPHDLVASFRATLEEVVAADILLLVRDASTLGTPLFDAQRASVHGVLTSIGTAQHLGASVIEVWNKIDRCDAAQRDELQRRLFEASQRRAQQQQQQQEEEEAEEGEEESGDDNCPPSPSPPPLAPLIVPVSALTGEGLGALKAVIAEALVAGEHVVAAVAPRSTTLNGDAGDAREGEEEETEKKGQAKQV